MTGAAAALFVGAACVAFLDWIAVARGLHPLEYVAKPLTMALLIAAALALNPTDSAQRGWFVVALVFSLAGDVFLMPPREQFLFGLASFFVAHIVYIVGFVATGEISGAKLMIAIALLALVDLIVLRAMVPPMRRNDTARSFIGPVIAYATIISVMVAVAVAHGIWLAAFGAIVFMLSDLAIAWNKFVRPISQARLFIIVTYHLGQGALVASLVL